MINNMNWNIIFPILVFLVFHQAKELHSIKISPPNNSRLSKREAKENIVSPQEKDNALEYIIRQKRNINRDELQSEISKNMFDDPDLRYIMLGSKIGNMNPENLNALATSNGMSKREAKESIDSLQESENAFAGMTRQKRNINRDELQSEISKNMFDDPDLRYIMLGSKIGNMNPEDLNVLAALNGMSKREAKEGFDSLQESENAFAGMTRQKRNINRDELQSEISKNMFDDPDLRYIMLGSKIGNMNPEDLNALATSNGMSKREAKENNFIPQEKENAFKV